MPGIHTLHDLKGAFQELLERNEASLEEMGKTKFPHLKAYLVESNIDSPRDAVCPLGQWKALDVDGWYIGAEGEFRNKVALCVFSKRVWILYTSLGKKQTSAIERWIDSTVGLDRCWLSRRQLLNWDEHGLWVRRGMGFRFDDGLTPMNKAGNFSLKAWYGERSKIGGLDEILEIAEKHFAPHSVRWQKADDEEVRITSEWYSSGKVTINRAVDVEEVMLSLEVMANRYEAALKEATELRDKYMGSFELEFSQKIDLEAFSEVVSKGKGKMRLWLIELERKDGFRRYRGVDLHTWDNIILDAGEDYAYISIPRKGCVNATPRIAVLQGEDNAGRTSIYYNGEEVFA